jgi:hypothetical protein
MMWVRIVSVEVIYEAIWSGNTRENEFRDIVQGTLLVLMAINDRRFLRKALEAIVVAGFH